MAALLLSLSLTASDGLAWLVLAALAIPLLGICTSGESGPHLALAMTATAIGAVFFITPYFLQQSPGESATTRAGITILAVPAGMALTGPVGGFLGDWWGARRTAVLGAAPFTVGLTLLLPMDRPWEPEDLAWRLFLAGCGNGLLNGPNMAIAVTNAPGSLLATTGASTSLARQMGFALRPALATLTWALSAYQPEGMRAAMVLAWCSAPRRS